MHIDPLHPKGWAAAKGYSNGMLVEGASRLIFVAGQIAWDADQKMVGVGDFPAQFRQAMANVIEVVKAGGGLPEELPAKGTEAAVILRTAPGEAVVARRLWAQQ